MKFLLKLIVLAVLGFVLYHFFGPQIDDFFARAKATMTNVMKGHHAQPPAEHHSSPDNEPKYYPIEKRTE